MSTKKQTVDLAAVHPFTCDIHYAEIDRHAPENTVDSHIHSRCEVYINLCGDVSFMVENQIYPISPGSIIITRPFEYHHCIYHSDAPHKHFCLWFDAAGNEPFLERFFNRPTGEQNLLTLSGQATQQLFRLCFSMLNQADRLTFYYRFFYFLHLLQQSEVTSPTQKYSQPVARTLDYIARHLTEPLLIEDLSKAAFVSTKTLERHFKQALGMTPSLYIKKKRLALAAKLLAGGASVAETCAACGVADYSYFIALFKKNYGITPLQYQKRYAPRE